MNFLLLSLILLVPLSFSLPLSFSFSKLFEHSFKRDHPQKIRKFLGRTVVRISERLKNSIKVVETSFATSESSRSDEYTHSDDQITRSFS